MPKRPPKLRLVKTTPAPDQVRKRITFDVETFQALDLLRREQMKELDEIAEEAFRDLLHKYGRTADFREALRRSAKPQAERRKKRT